MKLAKNGLARMVRLHFSDNDSQEEVVVRLQLQNLKSDSIYLQKYYTHSSHESRRSNIHATATFFKEMSGRDHTCREISLER